MQTVSKILLRRCAFFITFTLIMLLSDYNSIAAPSKEQPKRIPYTVFESNIDDFLRGPIYGPVRKVTVSAESLSWITAFDKAGNTLSQREIFADLSDTTMVYEQGRAKYLIRTNEPQNILASVQYDDSSRSFKLGAKTGKLNERGLMASFFIIDPKTDKTVATGEYDYNSTGFLIKSVIVDPIGTHILTLSYDNSGRLVKRVKGTTAAGPDKPKVEEYLYDSNGKLVQYTYYWQGDSYRGIVPVIETRDKYGNWTERVFDYKGNRRVYRQQLEYYE